MILDVDSRFALEGFLHLSTQVHVPASMLIHILCLHLDTLVPSSGSDMRHVQNIWHLLAGMHF